MGRIAKKQKIKMSVDCLMIILLPFLMGYEMVGRATHEWIGLAMVITFTVHHVLNRGWLKRMFKVKFTCARVVQLIVDLLLVLCMVGLAVSGIMLSITVFAFSPIYFGQNFARILHLLCSYWGFALMCFHLGLYIDMIVSMMNIKAKFLKSKSTSTFFKIGNLAIFLYGLYVFYKEQLFSYISLRQEFVFFDLTQSRILYILSYIAMMILFINLGVIASRILKRKKNLHI